MCMIAWRPVEKGKGAHIPNAVIDTALSRHPDGFGVAYRDASGVLKWERFGPAERVAFRAALKRVDKAAGEYVAHFRFATHGKPCAELAHPFEYTDPEAGTVLVFHNGVIGIATAKDGTESDTSVFVRDVLAALPTRWWRVPALRYLVGEAIGWSRLVLMTADETVCLQEPDGTWDAGLWYSSAHEPTPAATWQLTPGGSAYTPGVGYSAPVSTGQYASPATKAASGRTKREQRAARKAEARLLAANTSTALLPYRSRNLRHAGHALSAVQDIDFDHDGDYPEGVICDSCYTLGDLYVIDGTYYVDMAHLDGVDMAHLDGVGTFADAREEEALLASWAN